MSNHQAFKKSLEVKLLYIVAIVGSRFIMTQILHNLQSHFKENNSNQAQGILEVAHASESLHNLNFIRFLKNWWKNEGRLEGICYIRIDAMKKRKISAGTLWLKAVWYVQGAENKTKLCGYNRGCSGECGH